MVVRFEVEVPDDPKVALARAEALLQRYGFVRDASATDLYARSSRLGSGSGLSPRQVHATVRLTFAAGGAMAELRTDPMRGPLSALDRHVWKGEMDDLRAAIERVPGPGLDRVRENTSAGVLTGVTTILVFAIILPTVVRVMEKGWSAAAPFAAIIPVVVLYVLLPFPMPHYPLADAPTDLSNYPR